MVVARARATPRTGEGFAPGHITGIFSPELSNRDPRGRGSIGAGLVLDVGVHARARWTPGGLARFVLHRDVPFSLPISAEVARRLWVPREGRLEVWIRHDLPVGQGFGMSSAGALAVAFAVGRACRLPRQRSVEVAHLADLFGRGGLGGVAAILGGGLEIRHRPGIPPWGLVEHRSVDAAVIVGVGGPPLPSPDLLGDPDFLGRVRRAAAPGLQRLSRRPTLPRFFEEASEFGSQLHLASIPLARFLRERRAQGIAVAQGMFGNAFVAWSGSPSHRQILLSSIRRRGWRAVEVSLARRGATSRSPSVRAEKGF